MQAMNAVSAGISLPLWRTAVVLCVLAVCLGVAHEPRRWLQTVLLALPPLLWLAWPSRSRASAWVRASVLAAWVGLFAVDAAVRAYLWNLYGAAPNATLVVVAIANTTPQETWEYLSQSWPAVLPWGLGVLTVLGLMLLTLSPLALQPAAPLPVQPALRRARRAALAVLALPVIAAYAIKPWRRLHPLVFWPGWVRDVEVQRAHWDTLHAWRAQALERARTQAPQTQSSQPSTVVLMVSDSINRDNLGLYGYDRDTTPRLDALRRELGRDLVVFPQAWSVAAGTIPALRTLFQFGATEPSDPEHVLALAREAGWQIWWISTHDDVAIEQVHAGFAHHRRMQSRTPGRASRTPDDALLQPLADALDDPAPRKLIVLHAMGAHPHYRFRYPAGDNPFDDTEDAVSKRLKQAGRPIWIRGARDHYDAALRHHDRIVAATLEQVQSRVREGTYHAWMYLSDHGQEVGHEMNHAGHSARTEAGYRIPTLIWQSRPRQTLPADLDTRAFRADWAAWTLAHLLSLRWAQAQPARDALDPAYRWQAPPLGPGWVPVQQEHAS